MGVGQRYGVLVKRPASSAESNYTVRATTRTQQTLQGAAVLHYAAKNSKVSVDTMCELSSVKI